VTRPNSIGEVLPLTSLRFFAAFYVLLFHTLREAFALRHGPAETLIGAGYVSVSFFFTLSGYILAYVYLSQGKAIDKGRFWLARVARIYPVFLLTMLLDFPFAVLNRLDHLSLSRAIEKVAGGFFVECLMLQAWHLNWRVLDPPNWSLSVETFFYILFPFLGVFLWRRRTSQLFGTVAVIWLLGMGASSLALHLGAAEKAVMFNPILHAPEFVGGIVLLIWQQRTAIPLTRLSPYLLLAAAAGFLIAVFGDGPHVLMNNGLLLPVFALLILAASSGHATITTMLSSRPTVELGRASYALYLIHVPMWTLMTLIGWNHGAAAYACYVAATLGLSLAIFFFVEEPARRAIRNFSARPRRKVSFT
jgi:peptidoglycan/LPS O-acetylase OafA/YrhL